jgi:hypothetical protein
VKQPERDRLCNLLAALLALSLRVDVTVGAHVVLVAAAKVGAGLEDGMLIFGARVNGNERIKKKISPVNRQRKS